MSDDAASILDAIIPEGAQSAAAEEAPEEEPLAFNEPDDDGNSEDDASAPETPQQAEERLYAGKYRSIEELERGYQEAQRLISQRAQPEAEAQQFEEEEAEPFGEVPLVWPPRTPTELKQAAASSEEGAELAAVWAFENRARMDPRDFTDVINNWHYVNPAKAYAYQAALQEQEIWARLEARQDQVVAAVAPLQERASRETLSVAQQRARDSIGDEFSAQFDGQQLPDGSPYTWSMEIGRRLQTNPHRYFAEPDKNDPDGTMNALVSAMELAYRDIKGEQWWGRRGQAPEPAAQQADPRQASRATTARRGSASAPASKSEAEKIRDSIIGI